MLDGGRKPQYGVKIWWPTATIQHLYSRMQPRIQQAPRDLNLHFINDENPRIWEKKTNAEREASRKINIKNVVNGR